MPNLKIGFLSCCLAFLVCLNIASAQEDIPLPDDLVVITPENAAQLEEVARIGNGQIQDVAWSPDGEKIAVASTAGVWIFDSLHDHPQLLPELVGYTKTVNFSPSGQLLASADIHGKIYIWQASNHHLLLTLEHDLGLIGRVVFSPDSRQIAASNNLFGLYIWDIPSQEVVFHYPSEEHVDNFGDIVFSPNGQYVTWTVRGYYGDVSLPDFQGKWRLVDLRTGELLGLPAWHFDQYDKKYNTDQLTQVLFNQNSDLLIHTIDDWRQEVDIIQDYWTGSVIPDSFDYIRPDNEQIYKDDFRQDNLLVSIWGDYTRLLIENSEDDSSTVLPYWTPEVTNVLVSPNDSDSSTNLTISYQAEGSFVEKWDISGNAVSFDWGHEFADRGNVILALNGNDLLIGTDYGDGYYLENLEYENKEPLHLIDNSHLNQIIFRDQNEFLAVGNRAVIRWVRQAGAWEQETIFSGTDDLQLHFFEFPPQSVQYAYSLTYSACPTCNQMWVYDPTTQEHQPIFDFGDAPIDNGRFSHDGTIWAMANRFIDNPDGGSDWIESLSLWGTQSTMQNLGRLWLGEESYRTWYFPAIIQLVFSPDDRLLVAAYGTCNRYGCEQDFDYGFFKVWDTATQEELVQIDGHAQRITSIAFSPDGKLIITGSWDGTVRFWGVRESH